MREAWALFRRDVALAWREGGTIGTALGFYLVVVAITPLGLGPDLNLLSRIAPGVLWVALLLAGLLSADRIFHNDYEDGALDVLATGPLPLELVAGVKSLAHWVTTGIPLALLAPLLGLLLNLPIESFPLLVLAMLAGTPAVSFVAGIGASLTLGLRRSGVLLALLVLPLYVPVLIFGVATVSAASVGPASPWPPFLILCALSLASIVLAPIAAAAALRTALAVGGRPIALTEPNQLDPSQCGPSPIRRDFSALPTASSPGSRCSPSSPSASGSTSLCSWRRPITSRARRCASCSCTCPRPGLPCSAIR